ncbi:MAG: chromosome partition protein MukE [Geobacteraceae bacterium]
MTEEVKYETMLDVMSDKKFAVIDCQLRQGKHIGHMNVDGHSFLQNTFHLLNKFYENYDCELVHDTHDESDFFYLSAYGNMLGKRQLTPQEMITGMILAYMLMDPEYVNRSIPFDNLICQMKMLLGEEKFRSKLAPRQKGKNTEGDEQKAQGAVASALRTLQCLGFLYWPRNSTEIQPYSSVLRFLGPVRGIGNLEDNILILVNQGILEIDQFVGEDEESQEEHEDE